ncbi:universal stress protein [Mycobacterium sp. GA-2829]|uniref:universal stress protein n=1 Tax=Mycobacterium sp. GA-2829 TaxID=1772283 RepID=UPI000A93DB0B|nr:universal stress protein [Mycobacterium sp. GA-2829]
MSSETAIGQPAAVLVARSRDADLICVGSVGIGGYARAVIGSTAADLAERAQCPVAVIRPDHHNAPGAVPWIAVAATGAAEDEVVIAAAMREARLRRLPVLLLGPHPRRGGAGADLDSAVAQCGNGATTSTSIPWPAAAMSRASFATTMNRSN